MSHQGIEGSYSEFKAAFYGKVGDGSMFAVGEVNLIKVVLSGLKVGYVKRGKFNHFQNSSPILFDLYLFRLAVLSIFKSKRRSAREFLIGISTRIYKSEGAFVSTFFQRFFETFGREKFNYVGSEKEIRIDVDIDCTMLPIDFSFLFGKKRRFLTEVRKWVDTLPNIWSEEEKENIKCEIFIFLLEYLRWSCFLERNKSQIFFLIHHYHHEGLILACRENHVEVVELQHGLIAKEDIFYVMPEQVKTILKDALFPNKILVYGMYWKSLLLNGFEFRESDIEIIGYYQVEETSFDKMIHLPDSKKVILVTTQYSISEYYIDYVKALSSKINDEWVIVVKSHPAEKLTDYAVLQALPNVLLSDGNLSVLLHRAEIVISIFSTTLFDAVRIGKIAFSVNIPRFSDYVNGITETGIIRKLEPDENPLTVLQKLEKQEQEYGQNVYAVFSETRLSEAVNKILNQKQIKT